MNMQIEEIHKLLDRFYKGETSLDEEKRLSDFFRQEVVPKSLEEDRRVFLSFYDQNVPIPSDLEQRISALIDSFDDDRKMKSERTGMRRLLSPFLVVAASVLLVFGIRFFVQSDSPKPVLMADTYQNPNDAYRATMHALQLFSDNFEKGMQPIEKAAVHVEKTQKIIHQTIYTKQ
ncbi:MAG TPA: hypothetical protein PK949_01045 [Dysgonamonadaceae bacterium]|nr:hypothetical protein [Dysgonamonadaceae bacterium]